MTMIVLGVSGNSRILGLAIIQDNILVDFKAQLYTDKWSSTKVKRMIASLHSCIKYHAITNVALAIPHAYHTSPETKAFLAAVKKHCQTKNLTLTTYEPSAFDRLCEASKAKKKALMNSLAIKYPELTFFLRKELKNKHRYYHKLFEAVAAGTLFVTDHLIS